MSDINKCVLTGRLGADPELKQTTNGKAVCNFRIAVMRPKAKGAETAEADWFEIVTTSDNYEELAPDDDLPF